MRSPARAVRRRLDLAADDELLQVAARQAAGARLRIGRLDAEPLDHLLREAAHPRRLDEAARVQPVAGKQRVLGQRHLRHRAVAQPFLGHVAQAERATLARPQPPDRRAVDRDRRGRRQQLAGQSRHQLALAIAADAGDADDLAGAHREVDRRIGSQRQPADHQPGGTGRRIVRGDLRRIGTDHQPRQPLFGFVARIDLRDHATGAHHGAHMRERADLVQLVADEQHAHAIGRQLAQRGEQPLHRLRRQHRGRLVEDQQARRAKQRAQDLDPLALAHRQVVHARLGVDRQAVALGHLGQPRAHAGRRPVGRQSELQVVDHGQRVEQREVLMHHRHAATPRGIRAVQGDRRAVERDAAGIGLHLAGDHLHQRGLAGAVLAQDRVDLARLHVERDRIVGHHRRVALGDVAQGQARHGVGHGQSLASAARRAA